MIVSCAVRDFVQHLRGHGLLIVHVAIYLNICALTYNSKLQVDKHCSGNMLSSTCLTGVEGLVLSDDAFVGGHLPAWLYAVLQRVQGLLPNVNVH